VEDEGMKVLIFGGTGFIGRNLTKELLEKGYEVWVVTRNKQSTTSRLEEGVQIIQWDNYSPLAIPQNLKEVEAVINLAGQSIGGRRWTKAVKEEIMASRVRTTKAIVTAINEGTLQPKVLINASAVGYYGPRGDEKVTESDGAGRDFLAQVCEAWEKEAYKVSNHFTRVVTIRIGLVLGKEGALNLMALPLKLFVGGPLGRGTQWLSWIHVQDLVGIMRYIIENQELTGPVNGVAPNPVQMRDFMKILGKVLHRPSWFPVPEFLLKIVLGQMSEMLLHGQRVVPSKMLKVAYKYKFVNLEGALENIFK